MGTQPWPVLTFFLLKTVGDPLQYLTEDPRVSEAERFRLRAVLGLNDPLPIQFVTWLVGDTCRSNSSTRPFASVTDTLC